MLNAQPYIHYNLLLLGLRRSIRNQLMLGFSPFQLDSSCNQVWDQMIIALYTDLIHLWNGFTDSSLVLIQFNNGKGKSAPSPEPTLYASGAKEYLAWWWWLYSKGESGGGGVVGERTHFCYALPLERTHFSYLLTHFLHAKHLLIPSFGPKTILHWKKPQLHLWRKSNFMIHPDLVRYLI